jgi:hypothetical protein
VNDVDILPQYLKNKSLSDKEIILSFFDALEAIKILADNERAIILGGKV